VRYKIEVTIEGLGESWCVAQRYSNFVLLRSELVAQGYKNLPAITDRLSMFSSFNRVVHSRIIQLGFFLNECISAAGSTNETLNQFLAKPIGNDALLASAAAHRAATAAAASSSAAATGAMQRTHTGAPRGRAGSTASSQQDGNGDGDGDGGDVEGELDDTLSRMSDISNMPPFPGSSGNNNSNSSNHHHTGLGSVQQQATSAAVAHTRYHHHRHHSHHHSLGDQRGSHAATLVETDESCYRREALEHALGQPITWAYDDLNHSKFLVKELTAQRKALESYVEQSSNGITSSKFIITTLRRLYYCVLWLLCGAMAAYYYERAHIEHSVDANMYLEVPIKLTLLVLLLFRSTRSSTVVFVLTWALLLHWIVVAFSQANDVVLKYSEHWTMYKNHLQWLNIRHSVVVVPAEYTTPPCLTDLLKNSLGPLVHELTVGSAYLLARFAKTLFVSKASVYWLSTQIMSFYVSKQHLTMEQVLELLSGLVHYVDPIICALVAGYAIVASIMSSTHICRVLWIYTLGTSLITLYASLVLFCWVFRLRSSTVDSLFSRLDAVVAPFVVAQIGELRSIFVKFAQYFGGRSDVMSPQWTSLLSQLHDACPPSREEYVRETVESQLRDAFLAMSQPPTGARTGTGTGTGTGTTGIGEAAAASFRLEDIFESFDITPMASASIGQVHAATLKHSALMLILHNQQVKQQQRHQVQHEQQEKKKMTHKKEEVDCQTNAEQGRNRAESTPVSAQNRPGLFELMSPSSDPSTINTPIHAPSILTPSSTPLTGTDKKKALSDSSKRRTDSQGSDIDERESAYDQKDEKETHAVETNCPDQAITGDPHWYEPSTNPAFVSSLSSEEDEIVSVVVKVQHENIQELMNSDMKVVMTLFKLASVVDSRWEVSYFYFCAFYLVHLLFMNSVLWSWRVCMYVLCVVN
jgi:hypothetical protein